MKAKKLLTAAIFAVVTLAPTVARADGEIVSFGDGDRVTERSLASGQNMVATVVDSSAETPTVQDEFGSAGLSGPNAGSYVDPSSNV